jgi:hypothetical protein
MSAWIIIGEGETIQQGDEYLNPNNEWKLSKCDGENFRSANYGGDHLPHRRRVGEDLETKIRRLEHNVEVMRYAYLPTRLEVATRIAAAIIANRGPFHSVIEQSFQIADQLIATSQEEQP